MGCSSGVQTSGAERGVVGEDEAGKLFCHGAAASCLETAEWCFKNAQKGTRQHEKMAGLGGREMVAAGMDGEPIPVGIKMMIEEDWRTSGGLTRAMDYSRLRIVIRIRMVLIRVRAPYTYKDSLFV